MSGDGAVLALLEAGEIEVEGRLPWSSNYTFFVEVSDGESSLNAVYKPGRGERPLWDFPTGLYQREVAAYELSAAYGLGLVPETVLRLDGPLGAGSLQRFVDADFSEHYWSLLEDDTNREPLRRIAAFDLLLNNADRKGGHCLRAVDGPIYAIDHGLCFHAEPKLRTVMWEFAGEELPGEILAMSEDLASAVPESVCSLIDTEERDALQLRARAVCKSRRFPAPHPGRRDHPWPLV